MDDLTSHSNKKLEALAEGSRLAVDITKKKIEQASEESRAERERNWLNAQNTAKIWLMRFLLAMFIVFVLLVFCAGLSNWPPNKGQGVLALESLFVEMVKNAKPIILIFIGFFFREYVAGLNVKTH